VASVDPGAEFQ